MTDQYIREEWVLVPKKPTPEMSRAVLEETRFCNPVGIYQKMLAAAPQIKTHPAITHCDNCGCDWLDNGLNPIGCPYCKQVEQETIAYVTRNEEGDPAMLFFDLQEAKLYCEPGEEPEALVLSRETNND